MFSKRCRVRIVTFEANQTSWDTDRHSQTFGTFTLVANKTVEIVDNSFRLCRSIASQEYGKCHRQDFKTTIVPMKENQVCSSWRSDMFALR